MREKISFELHQSTNLRQMSALFQYCHKTVLVLMNTSNDMNLSSLNKRLQNMETLVQKMEQFVDDLYEIQYKWMYVFHFVKFSGRGELDRDSARLFQMCSEDLKKIEMALHQHSSSLYQVCQSTRDNELGTANTIANLDTIMDDSHGNLQSLLDAYPRFSLLPYNKIALMVKAWLVGPNLHMNLLNECMHDLFEGVGILKVDFSSSQRRFICVGFTSYDRVETVEFLHGVPFTLRMEEFAIAFETQLREHQARAVDNIMLNRVHSLRNMLAGVDLSKILSNARLIFAQRTSQIMAMTSNSATNQSFAMANTCAFTEDLWLCLGHPVGYVIN